MASFSYESPARPKASSGDLPIWRNAADGAELNSPGVDLKLIDALARREPNTLNRSQKRSWVVPHTRRRVRQSHEEQEFHNPIIGKCGNVCNGWKADSQRLKMNHIAPPTNSSNRTL